jgi:hypothetical protein
MEMITIPMESQYLKIIGTIDRGWLPEYADLDKYVYRRTAFKEGAYDRKVEWFRCPVEVFDFGASLEGDKWESIAAGAKGRMIDLEELLEKLRFDSLIF